MKGFLVNKKLDFNRKWRLDANSFRRWAASLLRFRPPGQFYNAPPLPSGEK
jgi:hypothetical protein